MQIYGIEHRSNLVKSHLWDKLTVPQVLCQKKGRNNYKYLEMY